MKKYRGYLLVLLIAFCIQGCSKQQDVEDHRFVLAMGFERLNEKKVLVRYSYADFDKAQSDSGTKIPSRSVTFLATSLKDANKTGLCVAFEAADIAGDVGERTLPMPRLMRLTTVSSGT